MKTVTAADYAAPLDLWAYTLHASLGDRPGVLERLGHRRHARLPLELTDSTNPPPPGELDGYAEELDASAAAVADWIRDLGPRGRQLVHQYMGSGQGCDLAPPLVAPGPGLDDLRGLVEFLAARQIGDPPLPPAPTVTGYRVKALPLTCPACMGRLWSATPTAGVRGGTVQVEDSGEIHRCPGPVDA